MTALARRAVLLALLVTALGALTGNQAVQQVRAGLKAIYLSGWQVAADANLSGHTYPDQSLYPANSVPAVVRRINNALLRADEIARIEGDTSVDNWLLPIVADGEAGFGGALVSDGRRPPRQLVLVIGQPPLRESSAGVTGEAGERRHDECRQSVGDDDKGGCAAGDRDLHRPVDGLADSRVSLKRRSGDGE